MKHNANSKNKIEKIPNEYYLKKWEISMQMWDDEADRFWSRNNIFILLNGGFIALITVFSPEAFIKCVISVLGITFAYIWIRVNERGVFYLDRWKPVIEELEKHTRIPVIKKLPSYKKTNQPSSTTYMKYGIFIFLIIYCILLVISLRELLSTLDFSILITNITK